MPDVRISESELRTLYRHRHQLLKIAKRGIQTAECAYDCFKYTPEGERWLNESKATIERIEKRIATSR